ncbi:MAG: hypothetical protein F6J98_01060 [Moorea sp. SIO4G2]|nr:hypothetical protein [Moorena sp. SIO4G2]
MIIFDAIFPVPCSLFPVPYSLCDPRYFILHPPNLNTWALAIVDWSS